MKKIQSHVMLAALAIFALTYLLISFQNIPGVHIHRPAASLLGATAMVVFGVLGLDQAYRLVDFDTLAFILGMMILIGYLEVSGFFLHVEVLILRRADTPRQLLRMIILSSGLLSALFMNDTLCLMLTPLVLRLARRAGADPKPYLIALATSSNIGSVMTPMGNPQNMIIAIHSGIPFLGFFLRLAPIALIGLWLNHLLILRLYPEEFLTTRRFAKPAHIALPPRPPLLYLCLGATLLLLGLFVAEVPPPLAALGAACLVILAGATRPRDAFRHIDWELLLMFAGLFVVMGGLRVSGALGGMFDLVREGSRHGIGLRLSALAASSALASNVVSNVPCVVFFTQILPGLDGGDSAWLVLAMASTLAGNLTLIGSVANLIVLESSRGEVRVGFWEYCRVGTPLAAFLIAAGTLFLYYLR